MFRARDNGEQIMVAAVVLFGAVWVGFLIAGWLE